MLCIYICANTCIIIFKKKPVRQRRTAVRFFSRHAPRYTDIPVNRDSPNSDPYLCLIHKDFSSTTDLPAPSNTKSVLSV